jgi:predicted TIM-barrel fold metal-dependent hydrolase
MNIFDTDIYLPGITDPGVGKTAIAGPTGPHRLPPPSGYGFPNYDLIFDKLQKEPEEINSPGTPWPMSKYIERADQLVEMMDQASVVKGVLGTVPNDAIGEIVARYPTRLLGAPSFSPFDGMRGVRALEDMATAGRAHSLRVAALYDQLPASDRRYYPLYTKCAELNLPVRIYTAMTYANDRPWDLGHPSHIDQVAMDFPELVIIAGLGGWPWVMETVALARRHPKLYIDTAAHRPKYLGRPGTGWEPLIAYGNTVLQDKVLAGLSWMGFGTTLQEVIDEFMDLPLKEHVRQKWVHDNAVSVFGAS